MFLRLKKSQNLKKYQALKNIFFKDFSSKLLQANFLSLSYSKKSFNIKYTILSLLFLSSQSPPKQGNTAEYQTVKTALLCFVPHNPSERHQAKPNSPTGHISKRASTAPADREPSLLSIESILETDVKPATQANILHLPINYKKDTNYETLLHSILCGIACEILSNDTVDQILSIFLQEDKPDIFNTIYRNLQLRSDLASTEEIKTTLTKPLDTQLQETLPKEIKLQEERLRQILSTEEERKRARDTYNELNFNKNYITRNLKYLSEIRIKQALTEHLIYVSLNKTQLEKHIEDIETFRQKHQDNKELSSVLLSIKKILKLNFIFFHDTRNVDLSTEANSNDEVINDKTNHNTHLNHKENTGLDIEEKTEIDRLASILRCGHTVDILMDLGETVVLAENPFYNRSMPEFLDGYDSITFNDFIKDIIISTILTSSLKSNNCAESEQDDIMSNIQGKDPSVAAVIEKYFKKGIIESNAAATQEMQKENKTKINSMSSQDIEALDNNETQQIDICIQKFNENPRYDDQRKLISQFFKWSKKKKDNRMTFVVDINPEIMSRIYSLAATTDNISYVCPQLRILLKALIQAGHRIVFVSSDIDPEHGRAKYIAKTLNNDVVRILTHSGKAQSPLHIPIAEYPYSSTNNFKEIQVMESGSVMYKTIHNIDETCNEDKLIIIHAVNKINAARFGENHIFNNARTLILVDDLPDRLSKLYTGASLERERIALERIALEKIESQKINPKDKSSDDERIHSNNTTEKKDAPIITNIKLARKENDKRKCILPIEYTQGLGCKNFDIDTQIRIFLLSTDTECLATDSIADRFFITPYQLLSGSQKKIYSAAWKSFCNTNKIEFCAFPPDYSKLSTLTTDQLSMYSKQIWQPICNNREISRRFAKQSPLSVPDDTKDFQTYSKLLSKWKEILKTRNKNSSANTRSESASRNQTNSSNIMTQNDDDCTVDISQTSTSRQISNLQMKSVNRVNNEMSVSTKNQSSGKNYSYFPPDIAVIESLESNELEKYKKLFTSAENISNDIPLCKLEDGELPAVISLENLLNPRQKYFYEILKSNTNYNHSDSSLKYRNARDIENEFCKIFQPIIVKLINGVKQHKSQTL